MESLYVGPDILCCMICLGFSKIHRIHKACCGSKYGDFQGKSCIINQRAYVLFLPLLHTE